MRIAIVHFHLHTGGVTRVIQHACAALTATGHSLVVLSGEPPQHPDALAARVEVIPALGYEEHRPRSGPSALRQAMEQSAASALGGPPDLWHVHNHCLGKNLALPDALCQLARNGHRLLLQPHDFAEDGRPALYRRMLETTAVQDGAGLSARLYPLAPQIHYAALSQRDRDFLAAAGIPSPQLHRLPNAVSFAAEAGSRAPGKHRGEASSARPPELDPEHSATGLSQRRWLYPTRAIRRKNLGELLFWAALAGPDERFATTQAPRNPAEQPTYQRWVRLAAELALPVDLELGARSSDFGALLASSYALMTTSVAEGFGLAFLEPWLVGRPLAGRDLPEITVDFSADGLDLRGLYQRLPVPLEWLDATALRQRLDQALTRTAQAYARARTADDFERAWKAAVDDSGRIDFGRLDEEAQTRVLRQLRSDPAAASALDATSPPLLAAADLIEHNRSLVERSYMIDGYRRRLEAIYQAVLDAPCSSRLEQADGETLLSRFQAPERLFLLQT